MNMNYVWHNGIIIVILNEKINIDINTTHNKQYTVNNPVAVTENTMVDSGWHSNIVGGSVAL